jgi:predicted ATPase
VELRYCRAGRPWPHVGSRKAPPMPGQEQTLPARLVRSITGATLLPPWPVVLRALREAAGVNQEAWARALEVGRTTIQRWERGETVPDATGQARLLAVCAERGLFRRYQRGALADATLTAEALTEALAEARRGVRTGVGPAPVMLRPVPGPALLPAATPPSGDPPRQTNLPVAVSNFVGRAEALAAVGERLAQTRLLTLTGPGGVGKTRLAQAAAQQVVDHYADGVWLVELAPLADPTLVPQALAAVLGVHEAPGQPLHTTLTDWLAARQVLVVLDTCEHLVDGCAAFVELLLQTCPHLTILATSRRPLGLAGEVQWRVPALTVPDAAQPDSASLMQIESVRLFVERARAIRPDLVITDDNADAVVEICRRLDGIPLALELAAASIAVLSLTQIAARLADRLLLPTRARRTAPKRQQSLRATLDWSHGLLTDAERTLLRRLGVFAGGWTIEAAIAVCAGGGIEPDAVLDLVTELVEQSLIVAETHGATIHYRLPEMVRQYARERLEESEEADRLDRRHTLYVAEAGRIGGTAARSPG